MKYSQFLFDLKRNVFFRTNCSGLLKQEIINKSKKSRDTFNIGELSLLTAIGLTINACGNSPLVVTPDNPGIGGDGTPKLALVDKDYTNNANVNVKVLGPINKNIQIFDDKGSLLGQGVTDSKGNINISVSLEQDGTHKLVAKSKFSETNIKESNTVEVQIDSKADKLTIINDGTTLQTDNWLNKNELTSFVIKGSNAEGQAKIEMKITKTGADSKTLTFQSSDVTSVPGSLADKTPSVSKTYDWLLGGLSKINLETLNLGLSNGDEVKIELRQTDKADNLSEFSDVITLMVDTTPPKYFGDMPASASYGSDEIRISFDDMLVGDVETDKIIVIGATKSGRDISIDKNKGISISVDRTELIFFIEDDLQQGDEIQEVKYVGTNLRDQAGNQVEEFSLEWSQFDIDSGGGGGGGGGTITPTELKINLETRSDSGIKSDDYNTNNINPVFSVEGKNLSGSFVILKFKNKDTGAEFIAAETYADNDAVDLTVGKLLKKSSSGAYTFEVVSLDLSLHLVDGEYELEVETRNKNPVNGKLTSTKNIIIDSKSPGIISDSSGVTRETSTKFKVTLSEDSYIEERDGWEDEILGALSFIKSNGDKMLLGSGEKLGNLTLIGATKEGRYQKFKSFSFEVENDTTNGILFSLAKEKLVRLKIDADTFTDLSGNANSEQSGTSTYIDVRPPSGEPDSHENKKLIVKFKENVESVLAADLTSISISDKNDPGAIYDVVDVMIVGDKLEISISTASPDIDGRELAVHIPETLLKFTNQDWNNVEHDVLFDLRTPSTPTIQLATESDSGFSNTDHVTKVKNPDVYFSIDSASKGGTLKILIEGADVHGNRVKHALEHSNFSSSVKYSPSDFPILDDGRYEVKAFIVDQFDDKGNIGRLGGGGKDVKYSLEGEDADKFEISDEGILTLKDHIDVAADASEELKVDVKIEYGSVSEIRSVVVTIEDSGETPNTAPTFTGVNSLVEIMENTTTVGTFAATDADAGDTV